MANIRYMDVNNGDDALDGSSPTVDGGGVGPVQTMTRAKAVSASGDLIQIAPGVYPKSLVAGNGTLSISSRQVRPYRRGLVIFDFEQALPTAAHISLHDSQLIGIHFRNMGVAKWAIEITNNAVSHVIGCVFYQRDGAANTGNGVTKQAGGGAEAPVENCTFYNLATAVPGTGATFQVYSCYFKSCTTYPTGTAHDYNAYPGNAETHGINTNNANSDPGFRDVAGEDFRIDPADATALTKFMTLGLDAGTIGAPGGLAMFWDARFGPSRWISPTVTPGPEMHGNWLSDPAYLDPGGTGSTGEIVEDSLDNEPVVDLSVASGNPDALSARFLSPVCDFSGVGVHTLNWWAIRRFLDGPAGAVMDTDTFYPVEYEFRSSNDAFGQTEEGTGFPSWTPFEPDDQLDDSNDFAQIRVTYQIAHTDT